MSVASPYKGLAAFEDSQLDALFFFGRERDTEIVVANLIASRLTILYGPSGVGKSSLLLAAVARELRELPETPLVVVFSNWGDDPAQALARTVADLAEIEAGELVDTIERAQLGRDVYLVLDQAEEYFMNHDASGAFETALAGIVNGVLRVNVLLSLREDTLATLDRLKRDIPSLFANVLRLDRLDRAAGRAAIVRPLERWSELEGEQVVAEDVLVDRVLDGVGAGRIELGPGGLGVAEGNGGARGIEAPYLQLVMQRMWEVERAAGSSTLRAATLDELGGAGQVVADHLERAIAALVPAQREIAARLFDHLVTPSGTKIAHEASDLAAFAKVSPREIDAVTATLARHRILRTDESGRWEIFHDVLAGAVLGWKGRYDAQRAVERAREEARRRHHRLAFLAFGALVGLALATGLAVWAMAERNNAKEQAAAAQAAEATASQQAARARTAQRQAQSQAAAASRAKRDALAQAAAAERAQQEAETARTEAEDSARKATEAEQRANEQAAIAREARDRADNQAALATAASGRARAQAVAASKARGDAERATDTALREKAKAQKAAVAAEAGERLATARALLPTDPEGALRAALDSLGLDPTSPVEPVLREGLLRSRVLDVLPGGGGEIVSAIADADGGAAQGLRARPGEASSGAVVTTTRRGVIRVFDSRLGSLRRTIETGYPSNCASLGPDGRTLAVGGPDGTVRLYSIATGTLLRSLAHVGAVSSVAFSGDGRLLASGGANETAKVWDAGSGVLVRRIEHPRAVRSVSFSPDSTRLLTLSSDRFARLFDVATGKLIARLDQVETPTSAVFSPNGRRILTTGEDELPHMWDADTGTLVTELEGHSGNVLASAFAPSGDRVATASTDGTARVWEAETGRLVLQLVGHTSFVDAVTFSPDGRQVLTASRDGTARLWNAVTGAAQAQFLGHGGRVTSVGFARDGHWAVTASDDGTARTWSLGSDPQLEPIAEGPSPISDIAATSDGALVAEGRKDGSVTVRSADGRPTVTVRVGQPVTSVAFSSDGGRLLATGEDGSVGVWAVPKGSSIASFRHGAPVTAGAFLPDGRSVVTAGGDGVVRSWDLIAGKSRVLVRETGPVTDVAISPDGVLLATAVGDVAHVRPLRGGGRNVVFEGHRDAVTSVSFSPDGARLLTTSFDHDAVIWNVETEKREKALIGHVAVVRGAAFSPDGRWIVTAGPTRAGLWEAGPSTLVDSRLSYLAGHRGALAAVAFVGPGWRVYSGGVDGSLRRYDCRLCAGTDRLSRIATAKLARLESDTKR